MSNGLRQGERYGVVGAVVQLAAAIAFYWFAGRQGDGESAFLWMGGHLAAATALLAGVATLHAYLRRLAADEAAEEAATGSARQLFDNELDGLGRRQQALTQFERRLLPILAGLVAAGLLVLSLAALRSLLGAETAGLATTTGSMLTAAAVLAVVAIASFVCGKFVNAVAFGDGQVTLRPVGGELLLTALVAALATVAALIAHWEQAMVARGYAWVLAAAGVALGVERLALLIMDAYRPQKRVDTEMPVYESRLLGIFTQPEGAVRNLAEIIRYQFGITLEERALGDFLKRVLLPFLGAQALVLAALTTLVFVQPHETALVQGASRAEVEVLEPGLYWRLPWPLTRVTRVPSGRLQTVSIMPVAVESEEAAAAGLAIWEDKRFERELFLAASTVADETQGTPVNLAAAAIDVRFRVADPRAYFTSSRDPAAMLQLVSRRELSRYLLEQDLTDLMADGREVMATELQARIEVAAGARQLGVTIESVGVRNLQAPPQVAMAWDQILKARADAGRLTAEAEAYAVRKQAVAATQAGTLIAVAEGETVRAKRLAEAEAAIYKKLRPVHAAHPELLETRAAMDAIEIWLRDARKVIVASERDREVILLELKKARPDLLEGFEQ